MALFFFFFFLFIPHSPSNAPGQRANVTCVHRQAGTIHFSWSREMHNNFPCPLVTCRMTVTEQSLSLPLSLSLTSHIFLVSRFLLLLRPQSVSHSLLCVKEKKKGKRKNYREKKCFSLSLSLFPNESHVSSDYPRCFFLLHSVSLSVFLMTNQWSLRRKWGTHEG